MYRKIFFLVAIVLFGSISINAQMDIQIGYGMIGSSAVDYPTPIQDRYEGSRAQYLYRAADLNSFGMTKGIISAIKFYVNNDPNPAGLVEQYTIKIGTTTATTMPQTSWLTGTTTIYGPIDYQPTFNINSFTFSTPFTWNGTDNIVIEVCNGDPNNASAITYTYNCDIESTSVPYICGHTTVASNQGNLCGTNNLTQFGGNYLRPNAIFTWQSTDSCLPVNVPYLQNFETAPAPFLPVCMSRENIVGNGNGWYVETYTVNPTFVSNVMAYYPYANYSVSNDAWFYSRGIRLTADTSYNLSFRYGTDNSTLIYTEKMNVFFGTTATADSMINAIIDLPAITNYNSINSSTDFTPTVSGVYYLGFHSYTDANQASTFIDDIALTVSTTSPVKLLTFTGTAEGTTNLLHWQTATEANNSGFVLQRSADGLHFSPLAFIKTKAINGNSSLLLSYAYTDNNPFASITYSRWQHTDKDGKYSYSNIVAIKDTRSNELVISNVFPNPTKDRLYVSIITPTTQNVTILLTDLTGKIILQQNATLQKGDNTQTINIDPLSSGIYMLKVVCSNGCVSAVTKVVKEGGN